MTHSGNLPEIIRYSMCASDVSQTCPPAFGVEPTTEIRNIIFGAAHQVTSSERIVCSGHIGVIVWLTGLSGSGKSTLAMHLERRLFDDGFMVYVLDGDNLRHGLNSDLDFTPRARRENIRRVGEVASLFADAGFVCIAALISPYAKDRDVARSAAMGRPFFEVYLQADIDTCERRDPKGLYRQARSGQLLDFTGIDAPYDVPAAPDIVIDTVNQSLDSCVDRCFDFLSRRLRSLR